MRYIIMEKNENISFCIRSCGYKAEPDNKVNFTSVLQDELSAACYQL